MFTILIADDEERIRRLVSDFLRRDGYTVLQAADGGQAMELIDQRLSTIDLIILDVMMPVYDGWSVLRYIRSKNKEVPVMMLTARTEPDDIVRGLEAGADDYVTKPFDRKVLLARIKAVLRRGLPVTEGVDFDGLVLDEPNRRATLGGKALDLTAGEFDVLVRLVAHRGRIFARPADARSIDVQIAKLRQKLGKWAEHIETVRGVGYRVG